MRHIRTLPALLLAAALLSISVSADEGMYPLSEISKLNLKSKGLKIGIKEIYNPDGISLVQAICDVGGGTGEFVSKDGLVLTNHHIAFAAVTAASTPEHDYLKNGFTAATRDQELPARGYVCKIIESYRDVTAEVMAGIGAETAPLERATAIREKMNAIAKREEGGRKNVTCQVSEMFPGRSYVLFVYRSIQDVRLVYVPPIGVGNFGGEADNWVWPRHTGDFSFLRAYVAPDGSTAPYAKENVPFTPKRFLKVATSGVKEGDYVMILGYPGRTFRHKTSHFLRMQEEVTLPYISKRFDWLIATMENAGQGNRALELMFADDIKSYANTAKNYKGKIQGLRRLDLVSKKATEEKELQKFIDADAKRAAKYGTLLSDISRVYDEYKSVARQELAYAMLGRNKYIGMGNTLLANAEGKEITADARKATKEALATRFSDTYAPVEAAFLAKSLGEISELPAAQRFLKGLDIPAGTTAKERENALAERIAKQITASAFASKSSVLALADLSREELLKRDDAILALAKEYRAAGDAIRKQQRTREGELNRLEASLLDVKMEWKKTAFIPDANSTLRLTYGYIRGYNPSDATTYHPQTTLRGIMEKNLGEEPYDAPKALVDLYASKAWSKAFVDPILKDVPVAMLYNMDTTGGNSGSPVMNALGELVGVNFDRAYEATINDYQWSESYSRSIGADVRYILFVAKYLGHADFLLNELGVKL